MLHRIDDYLIDHVFQPTVIASGFEVKAICRIIWLTLIALQFVGIASVWIGVGAVAVGPILLLAVCTLRSQMGEEATKWRVGPAGVLIRLIMGGLLVWASVLLACDRSALMWLGELSNGLLLAYEYIVVCRDPPPRGRFSFAREHG